MSKSKISAGTGFGILVLLVILILAAGGLWIHSDAGRSYAAARVQAYASDGMDGSLEIGSLDEIDFFQGLTGVRVKATDVRFLAPDGRETIHVKDADVTLDLASILGGTVAIREAIARNGTVTIQMGKGKKLTIEETFGVDEGVSGSERGSKSVGLDLRHMNARNMRVVLHSDPETRYILFDVDGTVFVTRPEGGEFVTTELVDVSGTLEEPKFLGDRFSFSKLKGRIASEQTPMVEMTLVVSLDEGIVDTRLGIDPKGDPPIKIHLSPKGDTEVKFLTSVAKVVSFFGSDVEIRTD